MARRRTRVTSLRDVAQAARAARRPGCAGWVERVGSMPRLVRAMGSGEYAGTSMGTMAAMAGAVAYVVSPVDLVPEAVIPLLGLGDDTLVLAWLAAQLVAITEDFLGWERSRGDGPGGPVPDHVVR
ncbi:YkvA family protein [Arsenicicoccus dermatophilus]|uniref:YkvA family protein n=1 Tax=Arsenicicoccus dermatophilus TaxID=1076331 RepID=UPI003916CE6A